MVVRKILIVLGEYPPDIDVIFPFDLLHMHGHIVHAVSPDKRAGDIVSLRIVQQSDGRNDEHERPFRLNFSFEDVAQNDYDGVLIIDGGATPGCLDDSRVFDIIRCHYKKKGSIAAVSWGVRTLALAKVIRGRQLTGPHKARGDLERNGATYITTAVGIPVVDDNIVTASGGLRPDWMLAFCASAGALCVPNLARQTPDCAGSSAVDGGSESSRHERGLSAFRAIAGGTSNQILATLDKLSTDFGSLIIETGYGDLIARPGLSLKLRELATVGALVMLGNAPQALRFHCAGMLNTGWSPAELLETVHFALRFGGIAVVSSAAKIANEVLAERGDELGNGSQEAGTPLNVEQYLERVERQRYDREEKAHGRTSLNATGTLLVRDQLLTVKHRALLGLSMLIAKGNQVEAVGQAIEECLLEGWTRPELIELLIQMTGYVGWPITLAVTGIALQVFEKAPKSDSSDDDHPQHPSQERRMPDASVTAGRGPAAGLTGNARARRSGAAMTTVTDFLSIVDAYANDPILGALHRQSTLGPVVRELVVISALTATWRASDEQPFSCHVRAALDAGAAWYEIVEAILETAPYAGLEAVQRATMAAKTVFDERSFVVCA